jgi:nucleotide-binding universal stress UspA family protein
VLPFKKILHPTDFSQPAEEALHAALEMARHFSAELLIVHVVPPVPVVSSTAAPTSFNVSLYEQELVQSSRKMLDDWVRNKGASGKISVTPFLLQGDAAEKILQAARETRPDLILMATHGQTGWRHFVFGSVAEKVVRMSPCPVLTIHPPAEETETA